MLQFKNNFIINWKKSKKQEAVSTKMAWFDSSQYTKNIYAKKWIPSCGLSSPNPPHKNSTILWMVLFLWGG